MIDYTLDFTYADFQELTSEDFMDIVWSNHISEKIVSTEYYQANSDFISALTFDCYRLFQMDSALKLRNVCKMIEYFFFNLFRYSAPNKDEIN